LFACVGILALAAGALLLCWRGSALPVPAQFLLLGLLLLMSAILFYRGWIKLVGPIMFYDVLRSGRRGRYILMRSAYAGLLLFLLVSQWLGYTREFGRSRVAEAQLAQGFFQMLMVTQLAAVLVLTPVYVAGAIADEKNRGTLDDLLATDLRSREIVLGKLIARLGQVVLLVLLGLPILSLLEFLGGIHAPLVLAGFAATSMTLFGVAGISIFHSIYHRRPINAIAASYLTVLVYYLLSYYLSCHYRSVVLELSSDEPIDWYIDAFGSGNLVVAIERVRLALARGEIYTKLPGIVGGYALFYGIVGTAGIVAAMLRLRPVALRQASRCWSSGRFRTLFGRRRPAPGESPLLWKELYVEGGVQFNWVGAVVVGLLVVASFLPVPYIFDQHVHGLVRDIYTPHPPWGPSGRPTFWDILAAQFNWWLVRAMGTVVGCLLLLAVAVRAAGCISGERDRQTLDSLLATPLGSNQILSAKWLGNIVSVRRGWLWLGAIYLVGLVTGALHPVGLVLVGVAWFVYAAFVSLLGCWFSIKSQTTLRATVWTLAATVLLSAAHWLPWMCCIGVLTAPGNDQDLAYVLKFQGGLTPPIGLWFLPFCYRNLETPPYLALDQTNHCMEMVAFSLLGLGIWLVLTLGLWLRVSDRFRRHTNRDSERPPAPEPHRPDLPVQQPGPRRSGAVLAEKS
jgi:ABC-type transport system involved in multi-copper enzyme maturation permease subunit